MSPEPSGRSAGPTRCVFRALGCNIIDIEASDEAEAAKVFGAVGTFVLVSFILALALAFVPAILFLARWAWRAAG